MPHRDNMSIAKIFESVLMPYRGITIINLKSIAKANDALLIIISNKNEEKKVWTLKSRPEKVENREMNKMYVNRKEAASIFVLRRPK